MTKHTPGPWDDYDDQELLMMLDKYPAQLKLARAAPELLEAANLIHHAYASSSTNDELYQRIGKPISVLLAAIAKAEGRE